MPAPSISSSVAGEIHATSGTTGTFSASPGDVLLCVVFSESSLQRNVSTITVGGNNFTNQGGIANLSGSYHDHIEAWTYEVPSTLTTVSATITLDGLPDDMCYILYVISGADTSHPLDGAGGNPYTLVGHGSSPTFTYNTTGVDILAISAGGTHVSTTGEGGVTTSGWSNASGHLGGAGTNWCALAGYQFSSTSGPLSSALADYSTATGDAVYLLIVFAQTYVSPGPTNHMSVSQTLEPLNGNKEAYVGVAVKHDKVWFYNSITGLWNNDTLALQDPVAEVGGYPLSGLGTGDLFVTFSGLFGDAATIRSVNTRQNLPGFQCWDAATGLATVWQQTISHTHVEVVYINPITGEQIFGPAGAQAPQYITVQDVEPGTPMTVDITGKVATGNAGTWESAQTNTGTLDVLTPAYLELEVTSFDVTQGWIVGISNGAASLFNYAGSDTNSIGVRMEGSFYNLSQGAGDFNPVDRSAITITHYSAVIHVTVAETLAPVQPVITGAVFDNITLAAVLDDVTLVSETDVIVAGVGNLQLAKTLGLLVPTITGTVPPLTIHMTVNETLAPVTGALTGTGTHSMVVSQTLAPLTLVSETDVLTSGVENMTVAYTLAPLTPTITGTMAQAGKQPSDAVIN